jgi:hypothetical protein
MASFIRCVQKEMQNKLYGRISPRPYLTYYSDPTLQVIFQGYEHYRKAIPYNTKNAQNVNNLNSVRTGFHWTFLEFIGGHRDGTLIS